MRQLLPFVVPMLIAAGPSHAEVKNGAKLHHNNCIGCHAQRVGGNGSALYTRAQRRVSSLPALERQVRRCEKNIGLAWTNDEIADVTEYLNTTYYNFKPE